MIRYMTCGESHGKCLMGIVDGLPSGLEVKEEFINDELQRRQSGYGRGHRQQIEQDRVELVAGVYKGKTTGAPVGVVVHNKDFKINEMPELTSPRPGHADLAGSIKYDEGIRPVLERASARATAAQVAVGGLAKLLLREFDVDIVSHVLRIGPVAVPDEGLDFDQIEQRLFTSETGCVFPDVEKRMMAAIDKAREQGDTLGGTIEIRVKGVPIGLGSHVQYDRKLDGMIAQALMALQAIKGVEIGLGFGVAERPGSQVHDEIRFDDGEGYVRPTNNAGGFEGGMTNGSELRIRIAMKPIATLKTPLKSVDMTTKQPAQASFERSDVCAVTACGVVAEALVAIELARVWVEKFGGDSLAEMKQNVLNYLSIVNRR